MNGEAHYYHGGSAIEWSGDQGRTWSHPVWVHPALSPELYAPTVKPVFEQASPWDRPDFVADAFTGTIYLSGSGPAWTDLPFTQGHSSPRDLSQVIRCLNEHAARANNTNRRSQISGLRPPAPRPHQA